MCCGVLRCIAVEYIRQFNALHARKTLSSYKENRLVQLKKEMSCGAVCCGVLRCVAVCCSVEASRMSSCSVEACCVAVCGSMLQCVAV